MVGEDYRTASARLSQRLSELRRDHAPVQSLADSLAILIQLHLKHENPSPARAALEELGGLRSSREPGVEATYYLCAALIASDGGEAPRAVWFAERAIVLGRRHRLEGLLPYALVKLADLLGRLDRAEDAGRARAEAVECFEQEGQPAHAATYLLSFCESVVPGNPSLFHRALALAERGAAPATMISALRALGRWHLERQEYLPARHAFDRALEFVRGCPEASGLLSSCLSELASFEAAFHQDEAIRMATEALSVADGPFWKACALEAREEALDRLHQHDAARADLLEAARCFEGEGELELAKSSRRRARRHRLQALHRRLPPGVSRALLAGGAVLAVGLLVLWTSGWLAQAEEEGGAVAAVVLAFTPWVFGFAASLVWVGEHLRRKWRR